MRSRPFANLDYNAVDKGDLWFWKWSWRCFSQEYTGSIWATLPSNRVSLFNLHTHSCPTLQRACAVLSKITIILTRLMEKSTHLSRVSAGLHSLHRLMAFQAFDSNKQSIQHKVLGTYATVWLCQPRFFPFYLWCFIPLTRHSWFVQPLEVNAGYPTLSSLNMSVICLSLKVGWSDTLKLQREFCFLKQTVLPLSS